jgi:group I intron endonuclease
MLKICGIYCIKNLINGKIYIGSSNDIKKRFNNHKNLLKNNKHTNNHLQSAWNKYKEKSFEFIILEECLIKNLKQKEYDIIKNYKGDIYNLITVNLNGVVVHSQKTKDNWSKIRKGKKVNEKIREKRKKSLKGVSKEYTYKVFLYSLSKSKNVQQLDLNKQVVNVFISTAHASLVNNYPQSQIYKSCSENTIYKNYYWNFTSKRFSEEELIIIYKTIKNIKEKNKYNEQKEVKKVIHKNTGIVFNTVKEAFTKYNKNTLRHFYNSLKNKTNKEYEYYEQ